MTKPDEWLQFLAAHPEFRGSQPHEPDPENRVWPVFAEWRARRVRQAFDDILAASAPEDEPESELSRRLRTGQQ